MQHQRRKVAVVANSSLSLDSIISSASFFAAKWHPELKRNQSRDVLRLILAKMYPLAQGNLFHARMRTSHAALGAGLDLSREWTCKLIARLRTAGWIQTEARRLPDGTQEVTVFRPGKTLKRLLMMLLKSKQRQHPTQSRVNEASQKIPTEEEVQKNKIFFRQLREELTLKFSFFKK